MIPGVRALLAIAAVTLVPAMPASAGTRATANQPAIPQLKPGQSIWFETPELVKAATNANAAVRVVIAIRQQ